MPRARPTCTAPTWTSNTRSGCISSPRAAGPRRKRPFRPWPSTTAVRLTGGCHPSLAVWCTTDQQTRRCRRAYRYVYMYASGVWIAAVGSNANHQVRSSPAHYRGTVITGRVLSMAEDNSKDIFILATGSVYRVVPPGLCNHVPLHQQTQWPPGTGWVLSFGALAVAFAFYLIWSTIFGGQTISLFNGFRLSFLLNFCIIDNRTISANNFPTTADHQD